MTRDDIIRMTKEAGFHAMQGSKGMLYAFSYQHIEKFAKLIAAAEREACAKVCDELVTHVQTKGDTDAMFAAISCATAIRIRGNNGQT